MFAIVTFYLLLCLPFTFAGHPKLIAKHFNHDVNTGVQSVNFHTIGGVEKVVMTSGYKSGIDFFNKSTLSHESGFAYSDKDFNNGRPVLFADTAVPDNGLIYATVYRMHKVLVFDPRGRLVNSFGGLGRGDGQLSHPIGIDYSPSNKLIYVADYQNQRIQSFDLSGKFISKFGGKGKGAGEFDEAYEVRIVGDKIFTSDRSNNRIQVFSLDGKYLYQIGHKKNKYGHTVRLNLPQHISSDSKGRIYVADSKNYRVLIMTTQGQVLKSLEGGEIKYPKGVAVGSKGQIVISDFKEFQPGRNDIKKPLGGLRMFEALNLPL